MFEEVANPLSEENNRLPTAILKFTQQKFVILRKDANTGALVEHVIKAQRDEEDRPYLDALLIKPLNPYRAYWETKYTGSVGKDDNLPVCYTKDMEKPSEEVEFKQAITCKACPHFTGVETEGVKQAAACKFKNLSFLLFIDQPDVLVEFDMPSTSLQQAGYLDKAKKGAVPLKNYLMTTQKALRCSLGEVYGVRITPTPIKNRAAVLRFIDKPYKPGTVLALEQFITVYSEEINQYINYRINKNIPTKKTGE